MQYWSWSFLIIGSVTLSLCHEGLQDSTPTTQGVAGRPAGDGYQLLVAVVGSVTVTCVTILLALLALFFIRKTLLNRRRTFTYQSGSVRIREDMFFFFLFACFSKSDKSDIILVVFTAELHVICITRERRPSCSLTQGL